jgi:hypothetical protein
MFAAHHGHACAVSGDTEEANRLLAELKNRSATSYVPASSRAILELGLGNHSAAITLLEEANEERELYCIWLGVDRCYDEVRFDSRFQCILKKLGV